MGVTYGTLEQGMGGTSERGGARRAHIAIHTARLPHLRGAKSGLKPGTGRE